MVILRVWNAYGRSNPGPRLDWPPPCSCGSDASITGMELQSMQGTANSSGMWQTSQDHEDREARFSYSECTAGLVE